MLKPLTMVPPPHPETSTDQLAARARNRTLFVVCFGFFLVLLDTTDIHGRIAPWDYYANKQVNLGLAKIATLIKQQREQAPDAGLRLPILSFAADHRPQSQRRGDGSQPLRSGQRTDAVHPRTQSRLQAGGSESIDGRSVLGVLYRSFRAGHRQSGRRVVRRRAEWPAGRSDQTAVAHLWAAIFAGLVFGGWAITRLFV